MHQATCFAGRFSVQVLYRILLHRSSRSVTRERTSRHASVPLERGGAIYIAMETGWRLSHTIKFYNSQDMGTIEQPEMHLCHWRGEYLATEPEKLWSGDQTFTWITAASKGPAMLSSFDCKNQLMAYWKGV